MRLRRNQQKIVKWLVPILLLGALAVWIIKVPPERWWSEAIFLVMAGLWLWWTGSEITGNRKKGVVVSLAGMGLLIFNRLELLDPLMAGLWLMVMGLITLII